LDSLGRLTMYLSLPFDIIAGALIGYYAAKQLGYAPELGAAAGAIIGTLLMWSSLYREARKAARKNAKPQGL